MRARPKARGTRTYQVFTEGRGTTGVVQLSGFVRSQANIDRAVDVARRVKGVKSVKDDMRVK